MFEYIHTFRFQRNNESTMALARDIFEAVKETYHPLSRASVEGMLV